MPKLWVVSDLHLEFGAPPPAPPTEAEIALIAGDVHVGEAALEWLDELAAAGLEVVWTPGNHEYYHQRLERCRERLIERAPRGVHLLDEASLELGGLRFVGATLWTDFRGGHPLAMQDALAMNDFRLIRVVDEEDPDEARVFQPEDALERHWRARAWLETELARGDPQRTVVLTHHAPSERSSALRFLNTSLQPCFASALEGLVLDHAPALWVHGHMHSHADYELGATRILCNPRGYPQESGNGFDPSLVVDFQVRD